MFGAPLGLILSVVGVFVDKRKGPARMGLIIAGALVLLVFLMPVVLACFR